MARYLLGGWLVAGALLMAGVASGLAVSWPVRIDGATDLGGVFAVLGGWLAVYVAAAVLAVVDAVRLSRARDLERLRRAANTAKLAAVPYFLLNFLTLALLTGVLTVAGHHGGSGLLGPAAGTLFVVLTYLVMLPTSAYGIACLALLRGNGDVGQAFFCVNLVLHLLFVVDVPSTIVVAEVAGHRLGTTRAPGRVARNLLSLVVVPGAVLAVAWFVLGGLVLGFGSAHDVAFDLSEATLGGIAGTALVAVLTLAAPLELVLLVLVPVVPLLVFRTSVRSFLRGDLAALSRTAGVAKVGAVPVFAQNFVLCGALVLAVSGAEVLLSALSGAVGGVVALLLLGVSTPVLVVPLVAGTYVMMLVTSVPGVACLALMRRRRAISPLFFGLHLVLHLVFVADVVSGLVVAHRARQVLRPRLPAATPAYA